MDEIRSEAAQASINAAGHEPSEIRIRPIQFFGVIIVAIIALAMAVLGLVMRSYQSEERVLGQSRPALFKDETGQFPEPNLQRNTTEDMAKFREEERSSLTQYGWVDSKANIARIPIDRALKIVAERGLPPKNIRQKPTEKPVETKAK